MNNSLSNNKVRLVALNSQYIHTNLAVHYIAEALRASYINATIYEGNVNMAVAELYDNIVEDMPDIIAFSTYIFNIKMVVTLAKKIRELLPQIKVVFGGIEAENNIAQLLPLCDTILVGDGEVVFLDYINNGCPSGVFKSTKSAISCDIISPYGEEYFKHTSGKIAYFEASRGCPFRCSYCMSCKDDLRLFNLDFAKAELAKFRGSNIKVLKFVDRTANLKNRYAKDVLRAVIAESEHFDFPVHFEVAPELFDDEYFDIISTAPVGALQFEVGMQSFNEKTLQAINRKCNKNVIEHNIKRLIGLNNAVVHCDLIAGLPYEDLASLKESFNTLFAIAPHEIQLGLLKVLTGSELADTITPDYIYNSEAPYDIISTPFLSAEEVVDVKNTEIAVNKIYNSGRFKRTIARFIDRSAYDFFADIARLAGNLTGTSLNDIILKFRDYLVAKGNKVDEVVEYLRFDYFSTNNCRKTPSALFREHKLNINGINRVLKKQGNLMAFETFLDEKGALTEVPRVICCDYNDFDEVNRVFSTKFM
ncbi:MAG: DUF4080 domain-containing protein [Bacillota bacterium]